MAERRSHERKKGFTLIEVLIAMSILVVGATSLLAIFVAAVRFHTDRVEGNRITELLNFAKNHAQIAFNNYVPDQNAIGADKNTAHLPKPLVADLVDPSKAMQSPDPLIREAAEKFPGFKYEISFSDNDLTVQGASVVATIHIYGLSGKKDESTPFDKIVLTRSGTPVDEFFKSPSLASIQKGKRKDRGSGSRGK